MSAADTEIGVSADDLGRLFVVFQQIDSVGTLFRHVMRRPQTDAVLTTAIAHSFSSLVELVVTLSSAVRPRGFHYGARRVSC